MKTVHLRAHLPLLIAQFQEALNIWPQRMRSKCRFLIFVASLLAAVTASRAQNASSWRVYKSADGLPETIASSVTVEPHGAVWVKHLNAESISRLDGYEIKTIPSPGLGNNRIYESAGGQIWTVAAEGLQQFKNNNWIHYSIPEISAEFRRNTLSLFRPIPLYPVKQNHVLFLVPDGLMEFNGEDPAHSQATVLRAASQTQIQKFSSMAVARDGGLWITGANGLAKLAGPAHNLKPETQWQEHLLDAGLRIHNLREPTEDDEGGITALAESDDGDRQVLAYFDGREWTIQALPEGKIMRAWRGANKTWWAMTSYSLFQWQDGQKEITVNEEVSAHRYFDLAVEPGGIFWLATSDGLFRYAPLTWQPPPRAKNLNTQIHGITEGPNGALWVASASSLHQFQNNQWKEHPFQPGMDGDFQGARGLYVLTNGTIALEAGAGLFQFNPQTAKFSPIANTAETRLKPLGLLKDGTLCMQILNPLSGSKPYQLEVFDGTAFSPFPYAQPGVDLGNELEFLVASQNGKLWLVGNKGIACFQENVWRICGSDGSAPKGVSCLIEISENWIWCGIQDKIWEFDGKGWRVIRSGFDRVNALLKGHDGSVWVAADNGLYHHYHGAWIASGLPEGLSSSVAREIYEDPHGQVWAGTTRGLSLYHPEADSAPPKTYVRNLSDPQNTVLEGAIVTLSFSGGDKWKFTPRERLLFSDRLDDKDWSPYQEEKTVSFSDLAAGQHYFKVRSMDRNGNVDPSPASLEFAVAPPWYLESRLVAISIAGLTVALFFAGLAFNRHLRLLRSYAEVEAKVALRTKELAIANQELLHSQKMNALGTLAAGIAHDFNNILSIIKGSAQIIEDNPGNQDKILTRASRIKTVVEQGAGIVKAMLGFSGSDKQMGMCDVNAIVKETIQLLGDRFRREVKVQLTQATPLPQVPASKDFIQQILLNFIFNAAEAMTERRQVIVSAKESSQLPALLALAPTPAPSYVFISVKDSGCGIAPEIMPRIFEPFFTTKALSARRGTGLGLSMANELARRMDSGLAVESTVGQGSVFTLIIPVRELPVDSMGQKG